MVNVKFFYRTTYRETKNYPRNAGRPSIGSFRVGSLYNIPRARSFAKNQVDET
jgi:hypothetical protein